MFEDGAVQGARSEWEEFLGALDANVNWKTRSETLTEVCKAFAKSGLCNKSELMGMTVADLDENPKGAKRSIMLKAFDAVNLKEISSSLPPANQETVLASTIRQAVDDVSRQALSNLATAMRVEDKSVRVPMESMLKQTTLAGLKKSCLPPVLWWTSWPLKHQSWSSAESLSLLLSRICANMSHTGARLCPLLT